MSSALARGVMGARLGSAERLPRLDALRGFAVLWMVAYHFGFDLNHFGLLPMPQRPHSDPAWVAHRTAILSLFLFCAGVGQAAAHGAGQGWGSFWRRWAQVAACALLVSAGSALAFPRSWIAFGVLHALAVMLLLARLLAPLTDTPRGRGALLVAAAACIALPALWRHRWFDAPWLSWIGLVTRKPVTEDYVPLLPWFGVLLAGLALGPRLTRGAGWLAGALPRTAALLVLPGRWSLTIYMLHQPLFFALLTLATGRF